MFDDVRISFYVYYRSVPDSHYKPDSLLTLLVLPQIGLYFFCLARIRMPVSQTEISGFVYTL